MNIQPWGVLPVLLILGMGACTRSSPPASAPTSVPTQGKLEQRPAVTVPPEAVARTTTVPVPSAAASPSPSAAASPPPVATAEPEAQPSVVTSSDQTTQLRLPQDWDSQGAPEDGLEFKIANAAKDTHIAVQTKPKSEFPGRTLPEVSTFFLESTSPAMINPQVNGPTAVTTVNGHPAVQYTIEGKIGNIDMVMLHTAVETPQHYHQIMAAAPRSRFIANEANIQQVIQSFEARPQEEPAS